MHFRWLTESDDVWVPRLGPGVRLGVRVCNWEVNGWWSLIWRILDYRGDMWLIVKTESRVLMEACFLLIRTIRRFLWEEVIFDWGPWKLNRISVSSAVMTGKGTAKSGLEWWGILMVPGHPEPGKGHWSQIMWGCEAHLGTLDFT